MATEGIKKPRTGLHHQPTLEIPRGDQFGSLHKQSGSLLNENVKTRCGTTERLTSKDSNGHSLENTPTRLAKPANCGFKDYEINISLVNFNPPPKDPASAHLDESLDPIQTDAKPNKPKISIGRLLSSDQVSTDNAEKNPNRLSINAPAQLQGSSLTFNSEICCEMEFEQITSFRIIDRPTLNLQLQDPTLSRISTLNNSIPLEEFETSKGE